MRVISERIVSMYYSFIINPAAGNGRGKQNWETIKSYLDSNNIEYENVFTRLPGDATDFAQRTIQKNNHQSMTIVAVGGDGTLDETVNGILPAIHQDPEPHVFPALIPSGINNHFATAYGISTDPIEAFQQIQSAKHSVPIYVGHYTEAIKNEDGYFLNSLGIGFDAAMLSRQNNRHKRRRASSGLLPFLINSTSVLYNQVPFSLMVEGHQQHSLFDNAFLATCANHIEQQPAITQHEQLLSPNLHLLVAERHNWFFTGWLLLLFHAGKINRSRWGHEFVDHQFHYTTTSLEFVEKDGIEMGNRFVDISVDSVKCHFWQESSFDQ